ncbi:hypothetical protein BO94DRAFT_9425 [Aspergillus sclerotioniger CBS 115572]|uniref:Uncharacterized protein n=1 Tax=Aspergillus sclerotioniger CBS 115572 TaxID=1450535 RepID=A0A317XH58_9EURO|nr:hypothetical protein BO94DRAFT_9425 [Aspergillus sclerotioniger CBS 115572]PWY96420.1 hypothetical protein BO94DRAFT_9425 [Aspergillus sclerotioniger CBS 115572]
MPFQTYEQALNQIPNIMNNFLHATDSTPLRIVGDTPTNALDSEDYLSSITAIVRNVTKSVHHSHPDTQTRFLAAAIYERHSYFVLDLNNTHYDYKTAHTDLTPIPVYVLRLSRRPRIFRFQPEDTRLAERLADMHRGRGYEPLPLFEDHHGIVQYRSPRGLFE